MRERARPQLPLSGHAGGKSTRFHRTIGGFRGNEARGACRARPHGPSLAQRLPPVRCAQPFGREYGKVHLRRNQSGTGSEGGSARGRRQTLGNRHGERHLPRTVGRPRFAAVVPQPGGRAALARRLRRSPAKSNLASTIGVPATSIRLRSRVPSPASSARRSVLSLFSNGGVPRSAIGSNPITAMQTASVFTGLSPATMTPGLTGVTPSTHGPSPPAIVRTPSTIATWIGPPPTRSTTVRGTR